MYGTSAKSGQYDYYVCATAYRNGRQACGGKSVSKERIESAILDRVRGLILQDRHIEELVRLTNVELGGSLTQLKERLQSLDTQLKDVEQRLGRHYDALEIGKMELDDLAPRIKELKQHQDLLRRAKAEIRDTFVAGKVEMVNRDAVIGYLHNLKGVLQYGSVAEQRSFLRAFIQTIDLKHSQVTINYTLPLPPEGVSLDLPRVLDIAQYGGPFFTVDRTVFEMWLGSL